ncbi:uncharacterized protein TrAFT101_002712 [Trichoderma asperellum]|uniref:uncharacterized protein n=1 Tax=Trichoderma asperellum TaxID=101201 RepID=UPI00331FB931|nr:hypothetical protein TrAFT101_002712 [Trichoderma asperellum]
MHRERRHKQRESWPDETARMSEPARTVQDISRGGPGTARQLFVRSQWHSAQTSPVPTTPKCRVSQSGRLLQPSNFKGPKQGYMYGV